MQRHHWQPPPRARQVQRELRDRHLERLAPRGDHLVGPAHRPRRRTQRAAGGVAEGLARAKHRLLAEQLNTVERPELNALVRRAANEAAALAWVTFHPLLVFPALFEEKTAKALRHAARQAHIFANSRELLAA